MPSPKALSWKERAEVLAKYRKTREETKAKKRELARTRETSDEPTKPRAETRRTSSTATSVSRPDSPTVDDSQPARPLLDYKKSSDIFKGLKARKIHREEGEIREILSEWTPQKAKRGTRPAQKNDKKPSRNTLKRKADALETKAEAIVKIERSRGKKRRR